MFTATHKSRQESCCIHLLSGNGGSFSILGQLADTDLYVHKGMQEETVQRLRDDKRKPKTVPSKSSAFAYSYMYIWFCIPFTGFAVQEGAACVNTIITTAGRYRKSSCFNGGPPYVRGYAKGRLQLLLMNTIELKSPCFKLTHKRERILNGGCTCIYEFSSLLSAFASKASFFTMKRSWSAVPIKSLSSLAMM